MSSLTKVRRSFRKRPGYHAKNLPSLSTLRHVVEKFSVHGGVQDPRKGRKSSIKEAEVKKVETLYRSSQLLSLRTASRKIGLSNRKVSTMLRQKILKKAYKAKIRMNLTERQRKTRIAACKSLLRIKDIPPKVWFSDESWFYSDGIAQKKKQYFWAFNKDAVEPIESQLTPFKVMVWAAVSSKGLIGPYFLHKNGSHITEIYGDCVSWFVGKLKENHNLKSSWFMQDGAPSHTSHKSRRLIELHFDARVVGKFLPVSLPPYSPDLTPADFWLWPTLKMIIFSKRKLPFTSISSLKRAIMWGFNKLKRRLTLDGCS